MIAQPNFLVKQLEKQQEAFANSLSKLQNKQLIDDVHDWRVAVKKLRSYHKLAQEFAGKKGRKKDWRLTNELFNVTGKFRDLQMAIQLLTALEKHNKKNWIVLKQFLQMALPEAIGRMETILSYIAPKNITYFPPIIKATRTLTDKELIEKIQLLLSDQLKKINGYLENLSEEAHLLRKCLKDIFYWLSISPKNSVIESRFVKSLEKILDNLGDWHDLRQLLSKARFHRREFIPHQTTEYKNYKELERVIKKKQSNTLSSLKNKLEKWLKVIPSTV